MRTLEDYYDYFKDVEGLKALYCIHIETKKIQSKIVDANHNKSSALSSIKSLSNYIKRGEFEMMYIEELSNNMFIKNILSEDIILVISVDKSITIGTIFNILKKL